MTIKPATSSADERLLALFRDQGYGRAETPVLQPADIFLDLSGEDIRRRLFLTQGPDGREMCLRPEYTIPVCREHVARGGGVADYCYLGPVFRQRTDESGEFLQAGIESIGRPDLCPADADAIGVAVDGLAVYGRTELDVRVGDLGVFDALLGALDVSPAARRRLRRDIAGGRNVEHSLAAGPRPSPTDHAGLLAALEGQDPRAAQAFVEDVLTIAGIARVGGRTAGEIAERFLSRAAHRSSALSDEVRTVIRRYLAIGGDLDRAAASMRTLAKDAALDLGEALDRFEERTGFMAARGLAVETFTFAADFARSLDYYSGFIFEIHDRGGDDRRLMAAGGRYDRLFEQLGGEPVPAVGFSLWLDRLTGDPR